MTPAAAKMLLLCVAVGIAIILVNLMAGISNEGAFSNSDANMRAILGVLAVVVCGGALAFFARK